MTEAVTQLIQSGILGPVLVIAIYYIWHLTRVLNSVQEKRVAESKEVVQSIIRMSERYVVALDSNTRALEANKRAFEDLKETLQSLTDEE